MAKKTASDPKPDESNKTYRVAHAILHDGNRYDEGAAISLPAAKAKALLKSGAITEDSEE